MNADWEDILEHEDPGIDSRLSEALAVLDPASGDRAYWMRFRGWVMTGAARELARRRLVAELTVGDVVESWARAVLPTALLAATLAGLVLARGQGLELPPLSVEELLTSEIEGEPLHILLSAEAPGDVVTFAAEVF